MLQWSSGSILMNQKLTVKGSNPAFSVLLSFLSFFYFITIFLYFISFIHNNHDFFLHFLIMISPLLARSDRVGRLCWVGQGPDVLATWKVMTAVWNYFSRFS